LSTIKKKMSWDTWKFYKNNVAKVTFANAAPTDKQYQDMLDRLLYAIEHRDRIGVIFDGSQIPSVTFSQGMKTVKFLKSNETLIQQKFFASSVIVSSNVVKNVLNFVFKIQPPKSPNLITQSSKEATDFVNSHSQV
jgi:hypothetical protein